jgi:hypothetical protein
LQVQVAQEALEAQGDLHHHLAPVRPGVLADLTVVVMGRVMVLVVLVQDLVVLVQDLVVLVQDLVVLVQDLVVTVSVNFLHMQELLFLHC